MPHVLGRDLLPAFPSAVLLISFLSFFILFIGTFLQLFTTFSVPARA